MSETNCEHCGQMFCYCPDRHREPRTKAPEAGPVGDEFPYDDFDAWLWGAGNKHASIDAAQWGFTKGRASRDAEVAELRDKGELLCLKLGTLLVAHAELKQAVKALGESVNEMYPEDLQKWADETLAVIHV